MVEVIPLKYGVTFKRVFSDPHIFSQFASDVLGIPIQVDEVHIEYEHPEPVAGVKLKYDLFAEDTTSRTIIEEEGRRQTQVETVRAMLANGIGVDLIATVTGLAVSEIEILAQTNA